MAEYTVLEKEVEYILEWNNNKEEAEPITFMLKYLTNAERSRCMKNVIDAQGNSLLEFDNELLIKYGVSEISNFTVNGKSIVTARDFNNLTSFPEAHIEIATQVLTLNGRQDLKN